MLAIQVTPDWERLAAHIEGDAAGKAKLGWVREMYAFSIACALQVRACSHAHAVLDCVGLCAVL